MNFSIRTGFIALTIFVILVAAFFSGNAIFISVCSLAVFASILVALPMALVLGSHKGRVSCFAFFTVSLGVFLASDYFSVKDAMATAAISSMEKQQPIPANGQFLLPPAIPNPIQPNFAPAPIGIGPNGLPLLNGTPMASYTSNFFELQELKKLTMLLIACAIGLVSGFVVSRFAPANAMPVLNVTPQARKAG